MTISSMTGFASGRGTAAGMDWVLEMRSVNARGLDIRIRLPEGLDALEPKLRASLQKALDRGSVQVGLRLLASGETAAVTINSQALEALLDAAEHLREQAAGRGIDLAPVSAGELLSHRAVTEMARPQAQHEDIGADIAASLAGIIADLVASRRTEGKALAGVMSGHVNRIEGLLAQAVDKLGDRRAAQEAQIRTRVAALLGAQDRVDEDRLAQELALIAVKSDLAEELDRLAAHIGQARKLLAGPGAVGRKLDFLMQEFNREANTLCSKSQDIALTEIGLEMKIVIDQMREQAANIE